MHPQNEITESSRSGIRMHKNTKELKSDLEMKIVKISKGDRGRSGEMEKEPCTEN